MRGVALLAGPVVLGVLGLVAGLFVPLLNTFSAQLGR